MKIPVGISACVLGQAVRYDGGHKRSAYCVETLGDYLEYQAYCPEMAIGLGVPRPTIRVVEYPDKVAVEPTDGSVDHAPALRAYASDVSRQSEQLCGFIVMKGSPSCGMERVKQFNGKGNVQNYLGQGAFTSQLRAEKPWLPIEESDRLRDACLRENFVLRVFALSRWRTTVEAGLNPANLLAFHASYKYILMAHSQASYRSLGQLLASLKDADLEALAADYISQLLQALAKPAGRKGNTNALMHIQGYFKKQLNGSDKAQLSEVIEQYRLGLVPLSAPVTLLRFLLERYPNEYLQAQCYFRPYPDELGLRNAIEAP